MSWCTIESDPGVFTELISEIGIKGVEVSELEEMSNEKLESLAPVHGMIFLFKWQKEAVPVTTVETGEVFFAKQVINNACGTQAILNVLLNCPEVDLGEEVATFKSFAGELPSDMRGLAIGNSSTFRNAHNSFARPEPFHFEEKREASEDDEAFHFIGFVPVNGKVYELDGLQEGPVCLGDCDMKTWYTVARTAIQQRMQRYEGSEIKFNLLAIHGKFKDKLENQLAQLEQKKARIQAKIEGKEDSSMDTSTTEEALPENKDALSSLLSSTVSQAANVADQVAAEAEKYKNWKEENVRRKHNYVPLIYNLLKVLAKKGKLKGLVDESKVENQRRMEAEKAKK